MNSRKLRLEDLKKLAEEFLKSLGYEEEKTGIENAIIFSRPTGFGVDEKWLIYFYEKGRKKEEDLRKELSTLNKRYSSIPENRRFLLSTEPLGKVEVKEYGFTYQVPVWFFDKELSKKKARTALKEIEKEARKYEEERIPQPYRHISKNGKEEKGEDLLDDLLKELENVKNPCLRVILAPAGYGKTVLMGSLYIKLYERFEAAKKSGKLGMRPLLMLPGHMKGAKKIDTLIDNFIKDEFDPGILFRETFNFWVRYNFALWLLDGLEELLSEISDEFFYEILDKYIGAPNSQNPQIIITIRKPLLGSFPEIKNSIDEWIGNGIEVYELNEWKEPQWKTYFEKNLQISDGEKRKFLSELKSSQNLKEICKVPYFCSLIADLKNENEMDYFNDEFELIKYVVDKFCEREFEKGLDKDIWPIEEQKELFKVLVEEKVEKGVISLESLKELAEFSMKNCRQDVKNEQIEKIKRHALLTHIGDEKLDFVQDIIKEYFLANYLLENLERKAFNSFEKLGEIENDSFLMKYVLKHSINYNWNSIIPKIAKLPSNNENAFRNIMKIFLMCNIQGKEELIRKYELTQNRNLTGLIFRRMNLSGVNFSGSNLHNVRFEGCDLENANFNNCIFDHTYFSEDCKLTGATTNGAIFKSLETDKKLLDEKKEIDKYFYEKTKVRPDIPEPCQATINMIKILERIARKGKGFWMPRKFLTHTKCSGISADRCVESLLKYRILVDDGKNVRIQIAKYEEIQSFLRTPSIKTAPQELMKTLDNICPDKKLGCKHLPQM